jgi:hypothetical protein
MNIKLQGLLTARFQHDRYTIEFKDKDGQRNFNEIPVFFPMAFAGQGRIHACLAGRSIPITLEPKPPGSPCQPFRFFEAQRSIRNLAERLRQWGATTDKLFADIAPYKEDRFPPELSWRQRDCAEPLLHIADLIGGEWPQRARQSLVNIFALAAFEDFYSSRQILFDLRNIFAEKGNPDWLSTADLLESLHTLDDRHWDEWNKGKPMHPKNLAGLLEPFGIHPKNNRTGLDKKKVIKGYYLEDLQPQIGGTAPCPEVPAAGSLGCGDEMLLKRNAVAANLQNFSTNSSGQKLEASSRKPSGMAVAANLQNPPTDGSGQGGKKPEDWQPEAGSSQQPRSNPYSCRASG